jgi:hypothetical protein
MPLISAGTSLVSVTDASARLALTAAQVNRFDEVEQLDTRAVYQVLDTALLVQEAGYVQIGIRPQTLTNQGGISLLSGLSAYWKLDETSGVRADSTANGFSLSDNNSVGSEAVTVGNSDAATFDGSTQYLSTEQTFDPSQSYSLCCWAKLNAAGGYQAAILIGGNGTYMELCAFHGNSNGPLFNLKA